MCLNETSIRVIRVHIGKNLSDKFPIQNGLKQGDILPPLPFIFALEYAIRRLKENQEGLKVNATRERLACGDDVSILGENTDTMRKSTGVLLDTSKVVGLHVNPEET
jgi:hypothetical protein